ncbi:MAG TPA: D-alanine--D-alanine ligase family protein [Chloroflexota bacterium]|nr:D-alanine--D-alanine ligase family protein [Chloroflexota bacterium]
MTEQPKKKRIRVGVVFGGRSGEHEVSLRSARSVIDALDPEKYDVVPIGVTKQGHWLRSGDPMAALASGNAPGEATAILADPSQRGLVTYRVGQLDHRAGPAEMAETIDVVFPVLHGTYGEDGTIQGLLEMANVPYVGAGVLGSALGMDKDVQKRLLRAAGLPVVDWVAFTARDWASRREQLAVDVELKLGYPCFVKPANLGSSVGITKARHEGELDAAVDLAARYDRKVVVEAAAPSPREIECSVLGNDDPIASVPGEVVPDREWYDYDAKYSNSQTQLIIPAQVPPAAAEEVRRLAVAAFRALECESMARVDFFVDQDAERFWINEINTIPGFTSISMYPKLWEASGIPYRELVDRLIQLAVERHEQKNRLRTER